MYYLLKSLGFTMDHSETGCFSQVDPTFHEAMVCFNVSMLQRALLCMHKRENLISPESLLLGTELGPITVALLYYRLDNILYSALWWPPSCARGFSAELLAPAYLCQVSTSAQSQETNFGCLLADKIWLL